MKLVEEEHAVQLTGETDDEATDCEDDEASLGGDDDVLHTNIDEEDGNANPAPDSSVYLVEDGHLMCL